MIKVAIASSITFVLTIVMVVALLLCLKRFSLVTIYCPASYPTTRIPNSSSSVRARDKKSGWRYLGNEKSYQRSAGVKTSGKHSDYEETNLTKNLKKTKYLKKIYFF